MSKSSTVHRSLFLVMGGVGLFFAFAVGLTMVAPRFIDPSWVSPTSYYQVQMYEVSDPNLYISSAATGVKQLQYVHHLKNNFSLLSFEEDETTRIISPPDLEKYITRQGEKELKLTSRLLLLREPKGEATEQAEQLAKSLQDKGEGLRIDYTILELYDPDMEEAFSISKTEGVYEDFVAKDFIILDEEPTQPFHQDPGVIFVKNPQEYRIVAFGIGMDRGWKYSPRGKPVRSLEELTGSDLGFRSRKTLIDLGQHIFAIEGCWYCHTDQTRTLVQDVVLNGSESYPAPPSSANEYIYQKTSFMGTRRIGPDLSRTAIKRPSRDWHKSHFWSPKTASAGSIMPSFRHFFDNDPRGVSKSEVGIPNYRFEAVYQYLMTKGSRITPPTEAWWLGKDPVNTLEIIEGRVHEHRR